MSLQRRFKKPAPPALLQPNAGPRLLNIPAAAAYLGCHVWALRTMVRNREIPHIKIGRGYLLDRGDLDRFIEKNKVGIAA